VNGATTSRKHKLIDIARVLHHTAEKLKMDKLGEVEQDGDGHLAEASKLCHEWRVEACALKIGSRMIKEKFGEKLDEQEG